MHSRVGEHIEQDHAVTGVGLSDLLILPFLLNSTGPCLEGCLEVVDLVASSSKYCLAVLALSKIILAGRGSEVEPEVDGMASEGK